MTMSSIEPSKTRASASELRKNRSIVSVHQSDAVSAVSSVGRNGYLGNAASAVSTLVETIDTLEKLLDQKAEAIEYADMGLFGLADALNEQAEKTAANLQGLVNAAYKNLDIVEFSGPKPPGNYEEAVAAMDAAETSDEAADIFEKLPLDIQTEIAGNRPDLIAKAAPSLTYIHPDVEKAFFSATGHVEGSLILGVQGSVEGNLLKYYVSLGGNIYAEVTLNSDGTAEMTIAVAVSAEGGKEIDLMKKVKAGEVELSIEAMARVGAIAGEKGYVTIKFDSAEEAYAALDGLVASFKDDVVIESLDDLPTNTWSYFQDLLKTNEDDVVWTFVHSQGAKGTVQIKGSAKADITEADLALAGQLSGSSSEQIIISVSDDGKKSISAQLTLEAAAKLQTKIRLGEGFKWDPGIDADASAKGQVTAKITLGTDSSGQGYLQVELNGKGSYELNDSQGSGVEEAKSYTATARVDLGGDDGVDIGAILDGDTTIFDEADITLEAESISTASEQLAEGGFQAWKIGGASGSAETYRVETNTDGILIKPAGGGFFNPDKTGDILESLPDAPP